MTRRPKRPPNLCAAAGCGAEIPRALIMCRPHWLALPIRLRSAINEAWRGKRFREWSRLRLKAQQLVATTPPTDTPAPAACRGSFHAGYAAIQRCMLGEGAEA